MEKRRPPPRRSFARVQRLPFRLTYHKPAPFSCSGRQTPRRVEKRRPPRAVLLPRVQRSPFRWTYHPPRPFRTAGGQSLNTAPPRGATSKRRPNIDNVDNRPAVWRRRGRPVLFFAPCAAFALSFDISTRPVPFVQQEAKASTHPRPRLMNCTAPDMDKYRQHGQPPNIEEIIRHAPNMDNMDNVDNRPAAGKEEAAPALFLCPVCSVRPFV